MFGKDKEKPGRVSLAILAGGEDEDTEASPLDMACDAIWTAMKEDDKEGFKESLKEYIKHSKSGSSKSSESESTESEY